MQDYDGRIARTPQELADWLEPLVDAGVDLFDCSQRRFWQPEFEGSPLNFAGWVKKLTRKPTISAGSVGVDTEMLQSRLEGMIGTPVSLDRLIERMERDEFDLVGVGRALIADPDWPKKVAAGRFDEIVPFRPSVLAGENSQLDYITTEGSNTAAQVP